MVQFVNNGFSAVPVEIPPTPAAVDQELHDLVINGWTDAHQYAKAAYDAAIKYLDDLSNASNQVGDLPPVDTNFPYINPDLSQISLDPTELAYLVGQTPVIPQNGPDFTEVPYASDYLNRLRAKLDEWVTGTATGLPPEVELAIWNRGRERETAQFQLKSNASLRMFAMRGWEKAPGALSLELQDAAQALQNTSATLSREVMTKQAELEQTNRRFALEQTWKVEEGMISYTNQQMNRALDMIKVIRNFIQEIYRNEVQRFGVQEQIYAAEISAKSQMYKNQIDAAIAEANLRIETAKANIQLLIQKAQLLIESIKGGAQVASQLAASSLSAVSLQGGIHSSTGTTASNSTSNSAGVSNQFQVTSQESISQQLQWSGPMPDNRYPPE